MYYEEKVINGTLMCRTSSDGEWEEITYETILKRYQNQQDRINKLENLHYSGAELIETGAVRVFLHVTPDKEVKATGSLRDVV